MWAKIKKITIIGAGMMTVPIPIKIAKNTKNTSDLMTKSLFTGAY
jgi:hypothetical protein